LLKLANAAATLLALTLFADADNCACVTDACVAPEPPCCWFDRPGDWTADSVAPKELPVACCNNPACVRNGWAI
jgi:hypothetical protein